MTSSTEDSFNLRLECETCFITRKSIHILLIPPACLNMLWPLSELCRNLPPILNSAAGICLASHALLSGVLRFTFDSDARGLSVGSINSISMLAT